MKSVCIRGHGTFFSSGRRWSSDLAWAVFRLTKSEDDVRLVHSFGQASKNGGSRDAFVKPRFNKKELARMEQKAFEIINQDENRSRNNKELNELPPNTKPHETTLCERCQVLGFSCVSHISDVMGVAYKADATTLRDRLRRIGQGEILTLYHQTDPETAKLIVDSQVFKPGEVGLAGGGIYFATSPEHTNHKARSRGTILRAKVKLGSVLELSKTGDRKMNLKKLLAQNKDSVLIRRENGIEYVVYVSDQVFDIEIC